VKPNKDEKEITKLKARITTLEVYLASLAALCDG
jgi:hypothetical protein